MPQLDRAVTATDQIRTVLEAFRDRIFTDLPRPYDGPKPLIFAKDDNHAEEIVKTRARGQELRVRIADARAGRLPSS